MPADLSSLHYQGPGAVHSSSGKRVTDNLLHRDRLTCHHRLINDAAAVGHDAVDGHPFTGANAKVVADLNLVERNVLLGSIVIDPPRGHGREAKQFLDR